MGKTPGGHMHAIPPLLGVPMVSPGREGEAGGWHTILLALRQRDKSQSPSRHLRCIAHKALGIAHDASFPPAAFSHSCPLLP